jgi:hypothetical protein
MSIQQTRANIISAIWKSIAQSKVDLSSVPADQQEILVANIADQLMSTVNDILTEENPVPKAIEQDLGEEEKILWEGRPFLSLVETYLVTTERLKIIHGFFGRDVEIFELIRLQDIDYKQHFGERMLHVGDITIRGHDLSKEQIVLRNIQDPEKVYEILRKSWLAARKRHGLQFRDFV